MAANVIVDAGFLIALLARRDTHYGWAVAQAAQHPPPWQTCDAVLSEAFHLLGSGGEQVSALLRREAVRSSFNLSQDQEPVLALLAKYAQVPMSLADACLVRMTEVLADPILLTTDTDFRIYRRHSRQTVPAILPA